VGVEQGWVVWDFLMGFSLGFERLSLMIRGGVGCLAEWISRAVGI
jgi:hypothetical protein